METFYVVIPLNFYAQSGFYNQSLKSVAFLKRVLNLKQAEFIRVHYGPNRESKGDVWAITLKEEESIDFFLLKFGFGLIGT